MTSNSVSLRTQFARLRRLSLRNASLCGNFLAAQLDPEARRPAACRELRREPGHLNPYAASFAIDQAASRGGAALRAGGLGTTMTITAITTLTAGTG